MGTRYNGHYSLIELGLVKCIDENGMKIYTITDYGRNVVEYLKDYDQISKW